MMPPYEMSAGEGDPPKEGDSVRAGSPRDPQVPVAAEDTVVEALRSVYDPEIPVNIYDLGLVYTVEISTENAVDIAMTLTAPGCPVAGEMPGWVEAAVESVAGVKEIKVNMTFDPPWGMEMMSDEARLELGFM